ncbi:MAG TPA: trehalose-phosphatase [Terriglobales bacterium]|nr:trehalose-phosphatase [Terriglobales bacterium]
MLVATDFDGTLAPIVARPEDAVPLPGAVAALTALAQRRDLRVAVVSGRALSDLRARCPVPGCWYVGGHGNETSAGGEGEASEAAPGPRDPQLRRELAQRAEELRQRMPHWPGARLEAKPYSLAVHFRQAPQWAESIRQAFSALAASGGFRVLLGRQVVELLPQGALTKGQAVQRLRTRLGCDLAFYFGDDATDEDVFRLRDPNIIGVKVEHDEAPAASAADFRLTSPLAVQAALEAIERLRPLEKKKNVPFDTVPP